MTTNAFAISRRLTEKGVEKSTADAVAEEMVSFSDENAATKFDLAGVKTELKSDIFKVDTKVNMIVVLIIGLYVGIFVLFMSKLI